MAAAQGRADERLQHRGRPLRLRPMDRDAGRRGGFSAFRKGGVRARTRDHHVFAMWTRAGDALAPRISRSDLRKPGVPVSGISARGDRREPGAKSAQAHKRWKASETSVNGIPD